MDDLRAAIDRALALDAATRLIVIDAPGLVVAAERAVFATCTLAATGDARGVVVDPARLPFVEALADRILARFDPSGEPKARLREVWRILAPAGAVIFVISLPTSHGGSGLISHYIIRRRWARRWAEAMFEPGDRQIVGGALVVRATKRDGLAPPAMITVAAQRPQPA